MLGSNFAHRNVTLRNVTLRNVALRNVALRQVELRNVVQPANPAKNYDKSDSLQLLALGKSDMYKTIVRSWLECISGYRSNGSLISSLSIGYMSNGSLILSLSIESAAPAVSTGSTNLGYDRQASIRSKLQSNPILLPFTQCITYPTCIEVQHAIAEKRCVHALF